MDNILLHELPKFEFKSTWHGLFAPYDLSVRFNWPSGTEKLADKATQASMGTTIAHEFHHYNTVIGTTWGLGHVRHLRSWSNIGADSYANLVVPYYRDRSQKIPVPLQRASRRMLRRGCKRLARWMRDFSIYTLVIYFDLGVLPNKLASNFSIQRPRLRHRRGEFRFGTHAMLECAARTEDRLRTNDFSEQRFQLKPEYDYLRLIADESGIQSPLAMLVAIDIALNPVLALPDLVDRVALSRFEPYFDVDAAWRYSRIHGVIAKAERGGSLPAAPKDDNGFWNRDDLNNYYLSILHFIQQELGFVSPVEALKTLASEDWTTDAGWGVGTDHIDLAIEQRRANPSAIAFQTLTHTSTSLHEQIPPSFIIHTNGCRPTIKDPLKGTLENRAIMRHAVVEQLICDYGQVKYKCPFCKCSLPMERHICEWGETFEDMVGIDHNQLLWLRR